MSQDNDPSNKPKPTVQNPVQPQPTNVVTTVASETTATTNPEPEVLEDTPVNVQKRREAEQAKIAQESTTTQTTTATTTKAEENKGK